MTTESARRTDLIEHADPDVREAALAMVDELTRPYSVGELEGELVRYYTRKKAREIVQALKFFDVVMLRPSPDATPKHNRVRHVHDAAPKAGKRTHRGASSGGAPAR